MTRFTTVPALLAAMLAVPSLACPPECDSESGSDVPLLDSIPILMQLFTDEAAPGEAPSVPQLSSLPLLMQVFADRAGENEERVIIRRQGRTMVVGPDGEVQAFEFESDDDDVDVWDELPDDLRERLERTIREALENGLGRMPQGMDDPRFGLSLARPGDPRVAIAPRAPRELRRLWPEAAGGLQWIEEDEDEVLELDPFANRRAWLGIALAPTEVDGEAATLIQSVFEDSPADEAGLREGDIILEFDDRDEIGVERLVEMINEFDPGDEIEMIILRDGRRFEAEVELGTPPSDPIAFGRDVDEDENAFAFDLDIEEEEIEELGEAREMIERLLRDRVAPRVERFELQAERLEDLLAERLEIIEEEVEEELEERFDELEERFDRLEEMMEELLHRFENNQRRNNRRRGDA